MYVDVKVGKRGEIVIPAFIRKKLKITPGAHVILSENKNRIEIASKQQDVVSKMRRIAKEMNLKETDLVYGDELYEEVFG